MGVAFHERAGGVVAAVDERLVGVAQAGGVAFEPAAGGAFEPVDADRVDVPGLVQQRAVPVEMVDDRPPGVAHDGETLRAQPAHVVDALF